MCGYFPSALGSIIIAQEHFKHLKDKIFPNKNLDLWLSKGKKENNEPLNGTIVTCVIAFFFVYIGDINFVAKNYINVFYGNIRSNLSYFIFRTFFWNPSYRPEKFKSRWYISLMGALLSIWLMFKMDTLFCFFINFNYDKFLLFYK